MQIDYKKQLAKKLAGIEEPEQDALQQGDGGYLGRVLDPGRAE